MNRTIEYTIPESQNGLRVEQFLRRKGYSRQNFTEIKRMPQSILVNGIHYYMRSDSGCRRPSPGLYLRDRILRENPTGKASPEHCL